MKKVMTHMIRRIFSRKRLAVYAMTMVMLLGFGITAMANESPDRDFGTHIPQKLNVEKMKEAVKFFEGEHDFKAFKASGTSSKSSVRTIYKAEVYQEGDRIIIELTGNGFLYNMVRIIAGTLVEVGLGKIESNKIPEIIENKKRENAGKTLPPNGLYLMKVIYD